MSSFSSSRYFKIIFLLFFYFKNLCADSNPSFSFKNFGKGSNFESRIALYGDAKVVSDGLSLQLTDPSVSSVGRVIYKYPIELVQGRPKKLVSFSTYFSFSMSSENENGLAFVLLPIGFPLNVSDGSLYGKNGVLDVKKFKPLGVRFEGNVVGIDLAGFVNVKVRNFSSVNLVLNGVERLQCWIDYEANSRELEVRVSNFGERRPFEPLIYYPIDLSRIWANEKVYVGLVSSNGDNSSRSSNVLFSWSFKLRPVPNWMHSQPLNPEVSERKQDDIVGDKKTDCVSRIFAALIFGIGCGSLGTLVVLFLRTVYSSRRAIPVMPEVFDEKPKDYETKKFDVVVEKASGNGKKQEAVGRV